MVLFAQQQQLRAGLVRVLVIGESVWGPPLIKSSVYLRDMHSHFAVCAMYRYQLIAYVFVV